MHLFVRLWRTRFTLGPVRVSSCGVRVLITSGTIPFVFMDVAVMKPVESSISFMKNTEPPSDSVKGPSTSV